MHDWWRASRARRAGPGHAAALARRAAPRAGRDVADLRSVAQPVGHAVDPRRAPAVAVPRRVDEGLARTPTAGARRPPLLPPRAPRARHADGAIGRRTGAELVGVPSSRNGSRASGYDGALCRTSPPRPHRPPSLRRRCRARPAACSNCRAGKRRATGLLLVMAVAFVVAVLLTDDEGWTGYLRAGLEASLVGGLADWFAVTALFRHPLGIPIPHTAVIKERKDQFGETLGEFVQENFLSADAIGERVRTSNAIERVADWLVVPENARTVAGARVGDRRRSRRPRPRGRRARAHRHRDPRTRSRMCSSLRSRAACSASPRPTGGIRSCSTRCCARSSSTSTTTVSRSANGSAHSRRGGCPGAVEDRLFDRLADGFGSLLQVRQRRSEPRTARRVRRARPRPRRPAAARPRARRARRSVEAGPARAPGAAGVDRVAVDGSQGEPPEAGRRSRLAVAPADRGRR